MEIGNYEANLKFGLWTRYSINGNLTAQASYINNKKDGNCFVYNEAGNKLFEMIYKDGQKVGIWNQWDENGKLIQTTNYNAL
jgi:antitoxin component YwqK of YwqJK toxin-antitoxin module